MEWLDGIGSALEPILDPDGFGVSSGLYECQDPCSLVPQLIVAHKMDAPLQAVLRQGLASLSPTYVATTFLSGAMGAGSQHLDWDIIAPVRSGALAELGISDICAIRSVDLGGAGIWFVSFRKQRFRLTDEEWRAFAEARRQIARFCQLRRKHGFRPLAIEQADVVFNERGQVVHINAPDLDLGTLPYLIDATGDLIRRSSRSESDFTAVDYRATAGQSVRWTALRHHDSDGRRCVLGLRTDAPARGFERLSAREWEVVARALDGETPKAIAYDLDVAPSTVRVLLSRAAKKVGARSSHELLDRAQLCATPQRTWVECGVTQLIARRGTY